MQKIIAVIFPLIFFSAAIAQLPVQYSFTNYNSESGLLSNQVNTIVQDQEGFIWIGTTDGLQRFDGTRYKSFRHQENDPASIPSNPVWQLLPGKENQLWILLADGKVGTFNTRSFTFKLVPAIFKKPFSPNTFVKRLITDEQGNIFYLVGGSEVITWDEKVNEFSYSHNFFKQKEEWNIVDFIKDPGTNKYLLSIDGGGLAVYNKATGNLSYKGSNTENDPLVGQYNITEDYDRLFIDRQRRLWSMSPGNYPIIHCVDLKLNQPVFEQLELHTFLNTHHEIKGFFQQQDSTVWKNGLQVLAKYLEAEKKFQVINNGYLNDHSIEYEMVHSLYEDREKNIWVGTDNNGLYRFNPATTFFTSIKHINSKSGKPGIGRSMSFIPTRWGTVLAGTWGDGLYQYDHHFNQVPLNIKGMNADAMPYVWSMHASRDSNTIWMGSQPGIYALNQATRSGKFYNPPVLENSIVKQIAEDKNGNLWLGTDNKGVFKWTAAKATNQLNDGMAPFIAIPRIPVNKITIDSKGLVWIATPENGVYVIDPVADKIAIHFTLNGAAGENLPERGASGMLEYNDSTIVITTATRIVLYNRNVKKTSVAGTAETISGFITAVERDRQGYLWVTSTSGLYRVNIHKKIFVKFNRKDGIENEHFIQSASRVLPDGKMLFGTTNDFMLFDPADIKIHLSFPEIKITDFKVMNNPLRVDSIMRLKEIELNYNDNSLTIEFSPLLYNAVYLIKYKLGPLDKNWKVADKNFQAIYNYLPPGTYSFLLKTMDEEGNESTQVKQLQIKVNPPFWKSWWFFSLFALAAGALLFWLDKERMRRKETIHKMRADIAVNLHEEVNTALSNINILSEMSKLKAVKEPEKSIEFIEQIHTRSQNMMIAMDDMLWGINPDNDSMAKAIERIREHVDGLCNHYAVKIDLAVDKKVEALKLNMKLKQDVVWFFKNGAGNIVRSGASNVIIHIRYIKPNLFYNVEFDNAGMNTQQLNNLLQRQELADKLAAVKGVINMQVHSTKSIIELTIPVN